MEHEGAHPSINLNIPAGDAQIEISLHIIVRRRHTQAAEAPARSQQAVVRFNPYALPPTPAHPPPGTPGRPIAKSTPGPFAPQTPFEVPQTPSQLLALGTSDATSAAPSRSSTSSADALGGTGRRAAPRTPEANKPK